MDQKDCRMLIYLEEEPNVTRAAQRLYISQPALAYRLRQIEESFDITFFHREGKKTYLTNEGRCLVHYARKQLRLLQETKDKLTEIKDTFGGNLRLGVNSYFCNYIFPPLLNGFHHKYPNIKYYVRSGMSSEIFAQLQNGDIDVAIVRGDFYWSGEKSLLQKEPIGIASHKRFENSDLISQPRIAFREPEALSHYPNKTKSTIEDMIYQWWNEHFDTEPNTLMEVDNYETCVRMVSEGFGYAVVPELFLTNHKELRFTPLVFKDDTPVVRHTWVYYREESVAQAVPIFLNYLRAYMEENRGEDETSV
ncbi:LysR family transcriptional regulator [Thalassobacillus sp. CUG 92003]|uniref:LysR family transcriptional regulator n=1 Tax=Thalassobacillus sp. CUG 92003 TaxID=2736641 RepID=UPI0015E6805D|nr:LysR family transcriptional regulator [Thalassobacillus sp. CUG 92003]